MCREGSAGESRGECLMLTKGGSRAKQDCGGGCWLWAAELNSPLEQLRRHSTECRKGEGGGGGGFNDIETDVHIVGRPSSFHGFSSGDRYFTAG